MNIGFVSTRFAGQDGVSLESAKWAKVLWDYEHISYWYAGQLNRAPQISMKVPEAFFHHEENQKINDDIWHDFKRSKDSTTRIHRLTKKLKKTIYKFVDKFKIDLLIIENALSIPVHIPLGIAITEFLAETDLPAIAHHHDFYWERSRFMVNGVRDYLDMAFPPTLSNIQHVTINSNASDELAWRKGLSSIIVPNVLDFENPPEINEIQKENFRNAIGLTKDDIMILQPTRVVPRKGIEFAITLVSKLKDPRCKLVVSHESGDEGDSYMTALIDIARDMDVELHFVGTIIGDVHEHADDNKKKKYEFTLEDAYSTADLITYPSLYEGFGNAFLEAIYYRKPLLINKYSIYIKDIAPKGFKVISMDGMITSNVVEEVRNILNNQDIRNEMTNYNYELATKHFSYSGLRRALRTLITNFTGMDLL